MPRSEAQEAWYERNAEYCRERDRAYKARPEVKARDAASARARRDKPDVRVKVRASNKAWRQAHPKKFLEYGIAYARRHPERKMWSVAKMRAKRRGMEFTITPSDIVIPEFCPVLGIKLQSYIGIAGKPGGQSDSPSLDRIDASKGYIPGNIMVMSHLANSMKRDASKDQLVAFARWVLASQL